MSFVPAIRGYLEFREWGALQNRTPKHIIIDFAFLKQESSSEDINFYYAMTMWAIATGNSKLEGLGRLQTGILARSINEYFLLKDTNTNHPADYVRNKVPFS